MGWKYKILNLGYVNFCTRQNSYLLQAFSYYWMEYMFIHLDIFSNTQSICSCDWLANFFICSLWKQEKLQFRLGVCKLLSTTVLSRCLISNCLISKCYTSKLGPRGGGLKPPEPTPSSPLSGYGFFLLVVNTKNINFNNILQYILNWSTLKQQG